MRTAPPPPAPLTVSGAPHYSSAVMACPGIVHLKIENLKRFKILQKTVSPTVYGVHSPQVGFWDKALTTTALANT